MHRSSILIQWLFFITLLIWLNACRETNTKTVSLKSGIDASAGGDSTFIITTPSATYYLEKKGGGLSSMVDRDGIDWIGFHKKPGSAHKGEYRGFPNAVHKQDGSYFHAMNAKTDPSITKVIKESNQHIRIQVTSNNKKWQGYYDFYSNRCDFTMSKVSTGYKYWVQYEGVPGGTMDKSDYWYASADTHKHAIDSSYIGDLPSPEWMAFGDERSPRVLYLLHHQDDEHPDNYVSRPEMTVLGFGRENKNKYLNTTQRFSIGFIESTAYTKIDQTIKELLK